MELHIDREELSLSVEDQGLSWLPFGRPQSRLRPPMKFLPEIRCDKCEEVGINEVSDQVGKYLLCDSCGHIVVKR